MGVEEGIARRGSAADLVSRRRQHDWPMGSDSRGPLWGSSSISSASRVASTASGSASTTRSIRPPTFSIGGPTSLSPITATGAAAAHALGRAARERFLRDDLLRRAAASDRVLVRRRERHAAKRSDRRRRRHDQRRTRQADARDGGLRRRRFRPGHPADQRRQERDRRCDRAEHTIQRTVPAIPRQVRRPLPGRAQAGKSDAG